MKANKLLVLFILPFLAGCSSSSGFKSITGTEALTKVESIQSAQEDKTKFVLKDTYTITTNSYKKETKNTADVKSITEDKVYYVIQIDVNKLMSKVITETTKLTSYSYQETYDYYDSVSEKIITLSNKNGEKTKTVSTISYSPSAAKLKFQTTLSLLAPAIKGTSYLQEFDKKVKQDDEDSKKYTDGQYFKYFYGTKDDKSIERSTELFKDVEKDGYKGKETEKSDDIIENYILKKTYRETKIEGTKPDTAFTYYLLETSNTEIVDTANIVLPNVDEYK